jgi:ammonium transporter, Amt family
MSGFLAFALCGFGTLLLRVASALHVAGLVRSKNSAGIVMRLAVDAALAVLAFWLVGGPILLGKLAAVYRHGDMLDTLALFVRLAAVLLATAIVVGTVAERSKFFPAAAASLLLGGLVVPLAMRFSTGDAWLVRLGYRDLAMAGPIHLAGALTAAVLSVLVGPRMGKYNRDGSSNAIPGHSVPLASLGVLLTFVAWVPYVLGFGIANPGAVAVNVLLSGSAGAVASLLFCQLRYGKPDIHLTFSGLLGALVAITPLADTGWPLAAILVGAVAGILVPVATLFLDLIWKIDDPTGSIAVHGVSAIWGLFATPFLLSGLTFADRMKALLGQAVGIATITALTLASSAALFLLLKRTVGLRSKEADEYDGLDLAEHDIGAYPDFQQTTIKSYHLREA